MAKIIIDNADADDFNELMKLARAKKLHSFYMTDSEPDNAPTAPYITKEKLSVAYDQGFEDGQTKLKDELKAKILIMANLSEEYVTQDKLAGWAQGLDNCLALISNNDAYINGIFHDGGKDNE